MEKDNSENNSGKIIRNKNFDPEKYGMVACPRCNGNGYIRSPKRQCCPTCGGFGFIIKETNRT